MPRGEILSEEERKRRKREYGKAYRARKKLEKQANEAKGSPKRTGTTTLKNKNSEENQSASPLESGPYSATEYATEYKEPVVTFDDEPPIEQNDGDHDADSHENIEAKSEILEQLNDLTLSEQPQESIYVDETSEDNTQSAPVTQNVPTKTEKIKKEIISKLRKLTSGESSVQNNAPTSGSEKAEPILLRDGVRNGVAPQRTEGRATTDPKFASLTREQAITKLAELRLQFPTIKPMFEHISDPVEQYIAFDTFLTNGGLFSVVEGFSKQAVRVIEQVVTTASDKKIDLTGLSIAIGDDPHWKMILYRVLNKHRDIVQVIDDNPDYHALAYLAVKAGGVHAINKANQEEQMANNAIKLKNDPRFLTI